MTDEAAEVIAVTLIQHAYAHLPDASRAGAIAQANTEPMRRMLAAITVEAYGEGLRVGMRRGRLDVQREMEADWTPMAARIRAQAGSPTYEDLERRWQDTPGGTYTGGPVSSW